jgi:hypothetical protein
MAGDKAVLEATGRLEVAVSEIRTEQTTQTGLLRAICDTLAEVLKAVTPEESADSGVPLDELLARFIMEMREHSKKLDRILLLLQGTGAGDGAGGPGPDAQARNNGAARGGRA